MRCGKPLANETEEYCRDCREKSSPVRQGRSLWLHRSPVSDALYRFKYKNKRSWGKIFAEELAANYGEQIQAWEVDVVLPIPLHPSRRRARGFNQSEILAETIADMCGLPFRKDVLYRVKKTVPQKMLGPGERASNLHGAFGVSRRWKPCQNVLLVDDIYTTGATVERAAKVLKIAGVQNVYFLTVSIGQGI